MTRVMPTTLSSDGAREAIDDCSAIQLSESSTSTSSSCHRMGGKDVFLWTVQEGRILNNKKAGRGAAPPPPPPPVPASCDVDLTRPASFSSMEGVRHPRGDRPVLARGRTASYDHGLQLLSSMAGGGGERAATMGRRLPVTRGKSSDFAQQRSRETARPVDDDDDSCFRPLVRRRTFTEATTRTGQQPEEEGHCYERRRLSSHYSSCCSGSTRGNGGGSGRVPMSVSEDNMLALLSKHHPLKDAKKHARVMIKGNCGGNNSSSSSRSSVNMVLKGSQSWRGGSNSVENNVGDGGGGGKGAQAWWDPNGAAASRASRNKFVIR
ncbi:unnamed protein product, partial [Laminaria digitata]